jgi:hypothetical protein
MRRALVAFALGASVLIADTTGSRAARQATPAALPEIAGARPAEARLLRDVLQTVHPDRLASVTFVQGPSRMGGSLLPRDVLGLRVEPESGTRGAWEAQMVVDLYVTAAARLHLRHVGLAVASNDRLVVHDIGLHGHPPTSLAPLRDALRFTGSHAVELRHVAGELAVTVRADEPLAFVTDDLGLILRTAQKLSPGELFVGVEDHAGTMVYAIANSNGRGWFNAATRELQACGPLKVGTLGPSSIPACPD